MLAFQEDWNLEVPKERERGREREKGEFRRTDPYSFQGLEIRLFRFSFFSLRKTQFPLFDFGV